MAAMNWLEGYVELLNGIATLGVNLLLQTTLVIAGGVSAARLCRRRGAAVQSAILRVTLAAALVCPVASWMLGAVGVPGFRVVLPHASMLVAEVEPESAPIATEGRAPELNSALRDSGQRTIDDSLSVRSGIGSGNESFVPGQVVPPLSASESLEDAAAQTVSVPESPQQAVTKNVVSTLIPRLSVLAVGYGVLVGAWLVATGLLLARLMVANLLIWRIRRTARRASAALASDCIAIARVLSVAAPPVLVGARITSPCLVGWWRPAILLPGKLTSVRADALAHELAHLRRGDCIWHCIGRLGVALLPMQPLLWLLARLMEDTADEVCDDLVVTHSQDRASYARELVDIAERFQPDWSAATAGVGITAFQSSLGKRVLRILDTSRDLTVSTGMRAMVVIVACGVVGAMLAGLVGASGDWKRTATDTQAPVEVREEHNETGVADDGLSRASEADADGSRRLSDGWEGALADQADATTVRGRVVGPRDRPIGGARLYIPANPTGAYGELDFREIATTDAEGHFESKVEDVTPRLGARGIPLIAAADGYGLDWIELQSGEFPDVVTLKLVDEVPIRGRILDSEGQPVADAKISLANLLKPESARLDAFLTDWEQRADQAYEGAGRHLHISLTALLRITPTDGDGRFEIRGLGAERLAGVMVSAANVAQTRLHVVLRTGFDSKTLNAKVARRWPEQIRPGPPPVLHAPSFEFVGEPARIVEGTVREAGSGRPVAGAGVTGDGGYGGLILAVTDEHGKFHLAGMSRVKDAYSINVIPGAQTALLSHSVRVTNTAETTPIRLNVDLVRGAAVSGRITDRASGKGVAALVQAVPLPGNPYASKPGYDSYDAGRFAGSSPDGEFRLVTIPGPVVLLAASAKGDMELNGIAVAPYKPAELSEADRKRVALTDDGRGFALGPNRVVPLEIFHAARVLDLDEQGDPVRCDLNFERGKSIVVNIEDADGKPLGGAIVAGMTATNPNTHRVTESRSTIYALDPAKPRRVLIYHPDRKLGGSIVVRGDELEPPAVRLKAVPAVRGRAVDSAGAPISDAAIELEFQDNAALYLHLYSKQRAEPNRTGVDGRFQIDGLMRGVPFRLTFQQGPVAFVPERMQQIVGAVESATAGSGDQAVELGDVTAKPRQGEPSEEVKYGDQSRKKSVSISAKRPVALKPNTEVRRTAREGVRRADGAAKSQDALGTAGSSGIAADAVTIRGHVVLHADGVAVPDASVVVVRQQRGTTQFAAESMLLAQARTSDKGEFAVSCPALDDASAESGRQAPPPLYLVFASRPGFGAAWDYVEPRRPVAHELTLGLVPDEPLEGRIVDLEGKPIAGVAVRVLSIQAPRLDANLDAWQAEAAKNPANIGDPYAVAAMPRKATPIARFPAAQFVVVRDLPVPAPVTTDSTGRFRMSGLGRDRLVTLELDGAGIATTWVSAVTRPMQPVPFPTGDSRFRHQICYGGRFDYVAEPGRTFRGVVRDADSKAPLAGVKVDVAQLADSPLTLRNQFMHTLSDEQGRFELNGLPLNGTHTLHLLPTAEQPYFRTDFRVASQKGQQPIEMTVELRRGVWIQGRLIDRETGTPVPGWVSYYPFLSNMHAERFANFDARLSSMGNDDRYVVGADGSFRIPAIAGRGLILGAALNAERYEIAGGASEIEELRDVNGGRAVYELMTVELGNAVREVEIDQNTTEAAYDLELVPAARHRVALLDPDGQPLPGVQATGNFVDSLLTRNPVLPSAEPGKQGYLDVFGLDGKLARTLVMLQKERNLGLTTVLDVTMPDKLPASLTLRACGRVTGRLLDASGTPLRGKLPHLSVSKAETVYGLGASGVTTNTRQTVSPIAWGNSDEAGRFEFASVPPGSSYWIVVEQQEFPTPVVGPGERIDLGDLRLKSLEGAQE